MVIIECRIKIFKFYKNIQQLANELNNSEFNNAVLAMKITLKITPEHNKANIKSSILDKWKVYHDAKEKFENAVKTMKDQENSTILLLEKVENDISNVLKKRKEEEDTRAKGKLRFFRNVAHL